MLFVVCWFIFKIYFFFKYIFRNVLSVEHLGSRSGLIICQSWSRSKLYAKVICRQHKQVKSYCINWMKSALVNEGRKWTIQQLSTYIAGLDFACGTQSIENKKQLQNQQFFSYSNMYITINCNQMIILLSKFFKLEIVLNNHTVLSIIKNLTIYSLFWERSGSVEECLTPDWEAVDLSHTGITVLCPWARTLILA